MQEEEDRVLKEHEEQLLKDLKEAVRAEKEGRKIARQTKPAIVLENREPPEIPEFKMEDPLPSNFTGEDAIWYMFRLSQLSQMQQAKKEEEEREKAKKLKNSDTAASFSGEEADSTEKVPELQVDGATATDVDEKEREGESSSKDTSKDSQPSSEDNKSDKSDTSTKSKANSNDGTKKPKVKPKKSKKKMSSTQTPPPSPPRPVDNQQSFERDPEVERILNEVVETLNRNQTPVQRKIPSRVIPRSPDQFKNSDEIRIRHSPRSRPWPSLDECADKPLPKYLVFTSTWLSVTAKGVK